MGKIVLSDKKVVARLFFFVFYPKDPAVLKILRRSKLLCIVNLLPHSDLLSRRTLCGRHFPWNCRHFSSQRRVPSVVNLGGVVKTLRRSNSLSRSVFSTAGPLGRGSGIFWPFLRSPAQAPTSQAVRGSVAIKDVFDNQKGVRSAYGGGGVRSLCGAFGSQIPLRASFNCSIVGLGPGGFNCRGSGVSLRI